MTSRGRILAGLAAVLLLTCFLASFLWRAKRPAIGKTVQPNDGAAVAAAKTPAPIADTSALAGLHVSSGTMRDDLRIVSSVVENYLASLSSAASPPPFGFNEDIVRALAGANPLGVVFIPANHRAIDAQGRLCDRWGTPYFFHPLSSSLIEIRSAGPDRKLFTADDGVCTPGPGKPAVAE